MWSLLIRSICREKEEREREKRYRERERERERLVETVLDSFGSSTRCLVDQKDHFINITLLLVAAAAASVSVEPAATTNVVISCLFIL